VKPSQIPKAFTAISQDGQLGESFARAADGRDYSHDYSEDDNARTSSKTAARVCSPLPGIHFFSVREDARGYTHRCGGAQ
jgi:hypothetical protein